MCTAQDPHPKKARVKNLSYEIPPQNPFLKNYSTSANFVASAKYISLNYYKNSPNSCINNEIGHQKAQFL
jgi:hypothetical protein